MSRQMIVLPPLALSVRQPWAWAIIHAGKDIENRTWRSNHPSLPDRGPLAIHAAKGMTQDEYHDAAEFMAAIGVRCPPPADLLRGGIIGAVEWWDVTRKHTSRWFIGPLGLVLSQPVACRFVAAKGNLGVFRWKPSEGEPDPPAKWMVRPSAAPPRRTRPALAFLMPDRPLTVRSKSDSEFLAWQSRVPRPSFRPRDLQHPLWVAVVFWTSNTPAHGTLPSEAEGQQRPAASGPEEARARTAE